MCESTEVDVLSSAYIGMTYESVWPSCVGKKVEKRASYSGSSGVKPREPFEENQAQTPVSLDFYFPSNNRIHITSQAVLKRPRL